MTETGL
jgi:hypothetical protein